MGRPAARAPSGRSGNPDWASVFTIDQSDNDLQETYLPNTGFPGDPWVTQDLSANYGTCLRELLWVGPRCACPSPQDPWVAPAQIN